MGLVEKWGLRLEVEWEDTLIMHDVPVSESNVLILPSDEEQK